MYTINEVFEQAVRSHQAGDLAKADVLYRQVIQADPNHAHAAHLLGLVANQTGHPQAALQLIQRAIALNPTALAFHFNLGMIHKRLGQFEEAARCYLEELRLNPNHGDSQNNLGIILVGQGKIVDAISCYLQALRINPNHADAYNNLGIARVLQGQHAEAVRCFQEALRLEPQNANTHINYGNTLKDMGNFTEAAESYRQALRLDPKHANGHNNLGLALMGLGQHAEAIKSFRQALEINPEYANAHNNLGNALQDFGQTEEAINSYRRAIQFNPNNANAHNNLGSALVVAGQLEEAIGCYRKAIELNPNQADAHNNLGIALVTKGLLEEGIASFERALAINPTHRMGQWNRACLRLMQGDFAGGWEGYEHRWAQPDMVPRLFTQPRWDGSPLNGKTILVHAEQGLGDTIQFVRYLPMIQERGGKVLFESQPALTDLLAGIKGVDRHFVGAELPAFDVQIPLLSLPGVFGTTLETIPGNGPYVQADPKLIERWGREIKRAGGAVGAVGSPLKVGIVWQGSMNQKGDHRSASLSHFAPLAKIKGVQLVSLQVGPGVEQIAGASFPIIDLGSHFDPNSLADLAGALMNVDMVVTVDTAGAHLAGALGVKVWVALALSADWRWLLNRSDNPWYPTMRLFRQTNLGEWGEVFQRIAEELRVARRG